jgi:hypothetical protein
MILKDSPLYFCLKAKCGTLGTGKRRELDDLLLLGYTVDHKGSQGKGLYGFTIGGFLIVIRRNNPVSRYNGKFPAMLSGKFVPVIFVEFPFGFKHKNLPMNILAVI